MRVNRDSGLRIAREDEVRVKFIAGPQCPGESDGDARPHADDFSVQGVMFFYKINIYDLTSLMLFLHCVLFKGLCM